MTKFTDIPPEIINEQFGMCESVYTKIVCANKYFYLNKNQKIYRIQRIYQNIPKLCNYLINLIFTKWKKYHMLSLETRKYINMDYYSNTLKKLIKSFIVKNDYFLIKSNNIKTKYFNDLTEIEEKLLLNVKGHRVVVH
jgi:hypothetical protein